MSKSLLKLVYGLTAKRVFDIRLKAEFEHFGYITVYYSLQLLTNQALLIFDAI